MNFLTELRRRNVLGINRVRVVDPELKPHVKASRPTPSSTVAAACVMGQRIAA